MSEVFYEMFLNNSGSVMVIDLGLTMHKADTYITWLQLHLLSGVNCRPEHTHTV